MRRLPEFGKVMEFTRQKLIFAKDVALYYKEALSRKNNLNRNKDEAAQLRAYLLGLNVLSLGRLLDPKTQSSGEMDQPPNQPPRR